MNDERMATEYGLAVDFEDGTDPEIVPAQDPEHAAQMARTIYAGRPCWTVQRELPAWSYLGTGVNFTPRNPG